MRSSTSAFFRRGHQLDGAEQTGNHQRRPAGQLADVGPRHALGLRQELVADDAVGPEIGDADGQFVFSGPGRAGQVHAPGRLPQDAEVLAVEIDFGQFMDFSQIEPEAKAVAQPGSVKINFPRVLERAGKVFEFGIVKIRPGFQRRQRQGLGDRTVQFMERGVQRPAVRQRDGIGQGRDGDPGRASAGVGQFVAARRGGLQHGLAVAHGHLRRAGKIPRRTGQENTAGHPCVAADHRRPRRSRLAKNDEGGAIRFQPQGNESVRPSFSSKVMPRRISPVSGSHNSGALPATRKAQVTFSQ